MNRLHDSNRTLSPRILLAAFALSSVLAAPLSATAAVIGLTPASQGVSLNATASVDVVLCDL